MCVLRGNWGIKGTHATIREQVVMFPLRSGASVYVNSKRANPVADSRASQISESRKYKVLRSMAFNKRSPVNNPLS
jgi:hypothetical protein